MLVAELEMDCCMKMAAELRGWWRQKREDLALQQREPTKQSFMIPSPVEDKDVKLSIAEEKALRAQQCTDEGFKAGLKAALWACVFSTVPTVSSCLNLPFIVSIFSLLLISYWKDLCWKLTKFESVLILGIS
ncbi:hypothetical protein M758_10G099200 [Ceratodon purpureus]|uniref:Uncharacterized protein n=1 Tax=Ceratodon purpureus TaxID=3225 RepID=A0A8T0GLF7_CERPU|nr:hypothetical protein KC19_10G101300 [Ceratodon purpureus]KAG0603514.1 hypothetical protein M758_10G099200 [Ceratodon purpureus]